MKSYTEGQSQYGVWTKNTSTANLSQGALVANDRYRRILAAKDWSFLEKARPLLTTTSQFINLPYDCGQVREVSVRISNTTYVPRLCPSRADWDRLNISTFTSDIPEWYFIFNGQIGLWPTPATAGNTITVTQKSRVIDLSVADYSTGTITSIDSGALAVVGSGSTWVTSMTGRYIRITYIDSSTNSGDGLWYEIAAAPTATTITLSRAYGGTTLAGATASYTIGQMPLLPEEFHDMPWLAAAADYWAKEDDKRAKWFTDQFNSGMKDLVAAWSSSASTDMVIDNGIEQPMLNPNLFINL